MGHRTVFCFLFHMLLAQSFHAVLLFRQAGISSSDSSGCRHRCRGGRSFLAAEVLCVLASPEQKMKKNNTLLDGWRYFKAAMGKMALFISLENNYPTWQGLSIISYGWRR